MDISSTLFENIDVITKIKIKFIKKKKSKWLFAEEWVIIVRS